MSESSGIDSIFGVRSMPKPCFLDLRERVLDAVETGASRREAAERFEVSPSSAIERLCYLLLEKLSKSLIPLSDCPFVLNRLPVFLGKSPCFGKKQGTMRGIRATDSAADFPIFVR
jgi:hypothetical protein